MKHKILSAAILSSGLLGLAGSAHAYGIGNFFAPVPQSIQKSNTSLLSIGAATLHQNYQEHSNGTVPDSESGNIHGLKVGMGAQGGYFGLHYGIGYYNGNTNYNGHLINFKTGAMTPYQTTTKNKILNFRLKADVGFSPAPNLAIMPDVFWGTHYWNRDIQGTGGYTEKYANELWGGGVDVAYYLGRGFTLSAGYQSGQVYHAKMDSSLQNTPTFNLGNHSWKQSKVSLTWMPNDYVRVFASYAQKSFGYGQSQVSSTGLYEPNSTTKQNVTMVGIRVF